MDIFKIIDFFRRPPKKCKKCGTEYEFKNLAIFASDLKWEEKTKQQEGNTDGHMAVTGTKYVKFTRYRVYYRIVIFKYTCPKCGTVKTWNKKYELYDASRTRYSQSTEEQINLLKRKIKKTLGKKFVNNAPINLNFVQT